METTNQMRQVTSQLVENLEKRFAFSVAEQFRCNIKQGYGELSLPTLIRSDLSPKQQFTIIRKALQDLESVCLDSSQPLPWRDVSFTLLRTLEDVFTSLGASEKKSTTTKASTSGLPSVTPSKLKDPKPKKGVKASETPVSTETQPKASSELTKSSEPVLSAERIKEIRTAVATRILGTEPLYAVKAQSYVKCTTTNCDFCTMMYNHLDLSACRMFGHQPCHTTGYFPHVGISMWKKLRKQHDAGQEFKPSPTTKRKEGDLPRLAEKFGEDPRPTTSQLGKRPRIENQDMDVEATNHLSDSTEDEFEN